MITLLLWIVIGSFVVMVPTAIAAKVLHEFSRHELEVYCRRRNQSELFDEVLDDHERFAQGAEMFQWVGNLLFLLSFFSWFFWSSPSAEGLWILEITGWLPLIALTTLNLFLLLLVNSWIPWAVVEQASAPFVFHTWGLWKLASRLAAPMHWGVDAIQIFAQRISGGKQDDEEAEEEALEEEIRTIVTAGERDGLLESPAREMIEGVINLDDIDVGDIMTPRSKVNALEINQPAEQLIRKAIDFGHTRIPIFEHELENIIGILFVKDLISMLLSGPIESTESIRQILREPQFVPISIQSDELLQQFQQSHRHLSIVVDEYESIVGVVTIEDVLEEIVGEITDETDDEMVSEFARVNDQITEVQATVRIDEVNEQLKIDLPDTGEFDTLAGLVMTHFGRIPKPGESMIEGNVKIEVLEATKRRVESLFVEILEESGLES